MEEIYIIVLLLVTIASLLSGFPVAFSLGGSALLVAMIGGLLGDLDLNYLGAYPNRLYGIMTNETLLAVPLFIFMGVILEHTRISGDLLKTMARLFGRVRGGLGISVCIVGALLAASTGIVGATVVTMGLISLPIMLKNRYNPKLACGIICASGTLGQIIPPSIVLVILGDQISSAYQQSLLNRNIYSGDNVSVGDIFAGALIPGICLVIFYLLYILIYSYLQKDLLKAPEDSSKISSGSFEETENGLENSLQDILKALIPPFLLILGVLGSILLGLATTTEAASVGCVGALLLAFIKKRFNKDILKSMLESTIKINSMVFMILIGASMFSLVFRAYAGDDIVRSFLENLPEIVGISGTEGKWLTFGIVMLLIFGLGFFLDFIEITFVVVPIVGPILLDMGFSPVWLGVVIALNLQTSFLTPPFGFALFYLRGVAPDSVHTTSIYKGAVPFIIIQILIILLLILIPEMATLLPSLIYP